VAQNRGVDVVTGIDINPAHELDQGTRFSPVVAAGFIQIFTDQMERHF
jgi:hypothetical protein